MSTYLDTIKNGTNTKLIKFKSNRHRRNLKRYFIAGFILFLFTLFYVKQQYDKYLLKQKYQQVISTLKLLSSTLKKGEQAVATLYTYENTVKKILK
ncbi:hypothetical protein [uncultured Polaribacter sp.]|uniref:hypothetical protein n=1 Tax=uncultured Polaribacter sp. TaxID=174711 RepID=UPI002624829E|nr:hypothetical protein [uncultured Polaribacter sp.]